MSEMMAEVLDICNTSRVRTCAYHPQSNGFVERYNRTLAEKLSMYVAHDQRDWDQFLQPVLWAYRSVEQSSSGTTPFEVVFGIPPRIPVDVALSSADETEYKHLYSQKLALRLLATREKVMKNLQRARAMQAKYYNTKINPKSFEEGDWVLLWKPFPQAQGAKKLTHQWGNLRVFLLATKRL